MNVFEEEGEQGKEETGTLDKHITDTHLSIYLHTHTHRVNARVHNEIKTTCNSTITAKGVNRRFLII